MRIGFAPTHRTPLSFFALVALISSYVRSWISWKLTDPGFSPSSSLPREILQEIQRLRLEHEQASQPTPEKAQQNPTLLAELRLLR